MGKPEDTNMPRVAMLVVNNGEDVRVLKEARALAESGYNLRVFGRKNPQDCDIEQSGDVLLERVIPITTAASLRYYRQTSLMPLTLRQRLRLLRVQLTWQLAGFSLGGISHDDALADSRPTVRRPSALKSIDTVLEFGLEQVLNLLVLSVARNPKSRLARKLSSMLDEPLTEFVRNEYLIYALSMYDAVIGFAPDVVHAHDLYMLQAGVKIKQKLECKLIYDAHEYERDRVREHPQWRKDLVREEEAREIVQADAVITVSDAISDRLTEHYQIDAPHVVFNTSFADAHHQGITKSRYTDIRTIIGINPSTPLVVHIGKLFDMHRQTGQFKEMIQALNALPDTHLALLGPNSSLAKQQVQDWAQRFNVDDRVHVVDPIPYEYVPSFIQTADVGIVAMHGDNLNTEYAMPNKLFEVALAYLPIIVSQQQQIQKFVADHAKGLCIDCNDPTEIAQAIREILSEPSSYEYTKKQKKSLLEQFSWPAQARKLDGIYATLLSRM